MGSRETHRTMKRQKTPIAATALLTSSEAQAAAETSVWVVWWEDPEKSWESISLSQADAEREYEARQADYTIKHWCKVGKSDRQSLLEWLEGHLRVVHAANTGDYSGALKEVLRRVSAGEPGSVIVRTW